MDVALEMLRRLGFDFAHPQAHYGRLLSDVPHAREGDTVLLTRHADISRVLTYPSGFSTARPQALGTVRPMIPHGLDPPEHTRYRRLLNHLFAPSTVDRHADRIRHLADRLLEDVAGQGRMEAFEDFVTPFCCGAFCHLVGLPETAIGDCIEMKDGLLFPADRHGLGAVEAEQRQRDAGQELYGYLEALILEHESRPRDNWTSWLLQARLDGESLTREDCVDVLYNFFIGGFEAVMTALGKMIFYLGRHEDQRQLLTTNRRLVPGAIEELLRWETPSTRVERVAMADVSISGCHVRRGDRVVLLLGSANLDAEAFPDPLRVDFEREPNRHVSFSRGPHRCIGTELARLELSIGLESLLDAIPGFEVVEGAVRWRGPSRRSLVELPLTWRL